jgi:hypothetical protein
MDNLACAIGFASLFEATDGTGYPLFMYRHGPESCTDMDQNRVPAWTRIVYRHAPDYAHHHEDPDRRKRVVLCNEVGDVDTVLFRRQDPHHRHVSALPAMPRHAVCRAADRVSTASALACLPAAICDAGRWLAAASAMRASRHPGSSE